MKPCKFKPSTPLPLLGWICSGILFVFFTTLSLQIIPAPYPLEYTEGIMAWGTKQISEGKWPYGDIEAIPSRYSTYGPLPYSVAALIASVFPDSNPLRFVQAGRLLSLLSATLTALLIGLACKNSPLTIATLIFLLYTLLSFTWTWLWKFRIDPFLLALMALYLFNLSNLPKGWAKWAIPLTICAITLTKPPSVLDLIPLTLVGITLNSNPLKNTLHALLKPLLIGGIAAPSLFFGLDLLTNHTMANNILTTQKFSGWTVDYHYLYDLQQALANPNILFGILALALSLGTLLKNKTQTSLLLASTAIMLFLAGTYSMKSGAAINYFFPLALLLLVPIGLALKRIPVLTPTILVSLTLALHLREQPHKDSSYNLPHANALTPENRKAQEEAAQKRYQEILSIHNQPNILSEEIFYSVAANQEPLVTDSFQFEKVSLLKNLSTKTLVETAQGAWAGGRVLGILQKHQNPLIANCELGTHRGGLRSGVYWIPNPTQTPTTQTRAPSQKILTGETPTSGVPLLKRYTSHILIPTGILLLIAWTLYKNRREL